MFEKCATKYMKNCKMQLKNKCKKNMIHAKAPNDVSPSHWKKIVEIMKKSMKEARSTSRLLSGQKEKLSAKGDIDEIDNFSKELKASIILWKFFV